MTHNDSLRSLRFLLRVPDGRLVEIFAMGGLEVPLGDVVDYLRREDELGFRPCEDRVMAHFLQGMVVLKRGRDESRPAAPIEIPVTNNTVLKKVRVAFQLSDSDIISRIERSGHHISKAEISAFFRRKGHRNYRECGDQFLRNLFKGLAPA